MATNVARIQTAVEDPHVPPQNLDAEESVLGAMMLAPGAIAAAESIIAPRTDSSASRFWGGT